jgi:hypothetical protein
MKQNKLAGINYWPVIVFTNRTLFNHLKLCVIIDCTTDRTFKSYWLVSKMDLVLSKMD